MEQDNRARLKQWLESGEARLQPLTFPQRELWETSPVPVADAANSICGVIEIKGAITPKDCEMAIQRVIERQEALRITFLPGKDRPLQMIRTTLAPALGFRELSPAFARPEALEELMKETYRTPFDLVQGPLFRVEMMRRAANDHVLAFSIHHGIADGWSLGVFVQDLCTAYVMGLSGVRKAIAVGVLRMSNTLPPVPQTYTEWGATERSFWTPAELERRAAFWKSSLDGVRRLWSPPTGPDGASTELERCVSHVPAELGRAVRDLARRNGATLFSTLLAAFQLALSRWTGADDIVVGTPVANRSKQSVRETMGYCSGIVPLRGQIDRERRFSDALRAVHGAAVDSFANAIPFAELVRALGAPPSPGRNPVFEVRFALQNHPVPDVAVPSLSLKLRMRSTGTARFDLGCEINEEGDALEVAWLFRRHIFPLEDIQNLGRMYLAVLAGVCRSPENRTVTLMATL